MLSVSFFRRLFLAFTIVLLSGMARAQDPLEFTEIPIYKKVNYMATSVKFAETIDDGSIITFWETVVYGSSGSLKIVRSDSSNPVVKEVKVKNDQKLGKGKILATTTYDGSVVAVYSYWSKSDEELQLWLARIDPNTLEIDSEKMLMAVASYGNSDEEMGLIRVGQSSAGDAIVAIGISGRTVRHAAAAYVMRYNLADQSGWTSQIRFDESYSVVPAYSEITPLTNNGAAITFRAVFPKNKQRVFNNVKFSAPHEYMAMIFDNEGKQSFSTIFEVDGHVVTEVSLVESNPEVLTVGGWVCTSEAIDPNEKLLSTGAFSTAISLVDYTVSPYSVFAFGRDLLGRVRNVPMASINNAPGYIEMTNVGRVRSEDGAVYIVAEERFSWLQDGYPMRRGDDVVIAKITPDGSIEWVSKLATRAAGYGEKYAFIHKGQLHVVFSDYESNVDILDGGYANMGNSPMCLGVGSFSADGKPSKQQVKGMAFGAHPNYKEGKYTQLWGPPEYSFYQINLP